MLIMTTFSTPSPCFIWRHDVFDLLDFLTRPVTGFHPMNLDYPKPKIRKDVSDFVS